MGQRKRVLYMEDETDLQWLARHILEPAGGFEVLVCSSGAQGLITKPFEPGALVGQVRACAGELVAA